jgi:D-glycero-D-manno-heptose 1,7-bisphosphate phosphatase
MNRGIFLDRDGVLNALVYYADSGEHESPRSPADLILLPGVPDALRRLREQGWPLFIVTNQPSYAKGKTSLENLQAVHQRLIMLLAQEGIAVQEAYYCYHHPDSIIAEFSGACDCRKPGIGSLLRARDTYRLELSQCWMIGDQDTDIKCGQNAGCKTIQLVYGPSQHKRGASQPDYQCDTLAQAVDIVTAVATAVKN